MIFVVTFVVALVGLNYELVNGSGELNIKYNPPYANRRDTGISSLLQLPDNLNFAGVSNEFSYGNEENPISPAVMSISTYNSPAVSLPDSSYSPSPPDDTYHVPASPSSAPTYGPPPAKSTIKKKFHIFALAGLCVMFVAVGWVFMRRVYFGVIGIPEAFARASSETSSISILPSLEKVDQILDWISGETIAYMNASNTFICIYIYILSKSSIRIQITCLFI